MGGGPPRKRCLCAVCRGLPRLALPTRAVCTLSVTDPKNHHTHTHKGLPERAQRIRSLSSFTLYFLPLESQACSPTRHLGSCWPGWRCNLQESKQKSPTAFQPSISHLFGGCGEGSLLLWEAVFFFKVALFILKTKLIGGEWQGFAVRPWLCVGSC